MLLADGIDVEQPVVQITAKAVHKEHRRTLDCAAARVADTYAIDVGKKVGRTGLLGIVRVADWHDVGGDVGVDLGVADIAAGEHAQQRLDRQQLTLIGHLAPQQAGVGGLDGVGDLVGFDVDDGHAHRDLGADFDQPGANRALGHRQAPFGHDDGGDASH